MNIWHYQLLLIVNMALYGGTSAHAEKYLNDIDADAIIVNSDNQSDYSFCINFSQIRESDIYVLFKMKPQINDLDLMGLTISYRKDWKNVFIGNIEIWKHEDSSFAYFNTDEASLPYIRFTAAYGYKGKNQSEVKLVLTNESLTNYLKGYNNSLQQTQKCAAELGR